jgi:hypothetical protein
MTYWNKGWSFSRRLRRNPEIVARAHAKGHARTAWVMAYPNFNPCTREGRVRNIVGCVIEARNPVLYRVY